MNVYSIIRKKSKEYSCSANHHYYRLITGGRRQMFDKSILHEVLVQYKQDFTATHWRDEKYKWEAVKWFQDHWDVNAENFTEMLVESLSKTDNLLASINNYPKRMIQSFTKSAPEEVRAMFIDLFDETKDTYDRINAFKTHAEELLRRVGNGARQHFQNENAISTYLWLRYPDKYYLYKFGEVKATAERLHSNYSFKKGAYADNIRTFFRFYDEINEELKKDPELVDLLQSQLTEACYPDSELKTLTMDVGFYISRYYPKSKKINEVDESIDENNPDLISDDWFPSLDEYSSGLTKEKWLEFLRIPDMIESIWGGTLAAFYAAGGEATCKQIAEHYHLTPSSIAGRCTQLAKRVYRETNCALFVRENGKKMYWPILFQGKNAGAETPGGFIWKLRPELYDALTEFDIMRFQWPIDNPGVTPESSDTQYWWLNANPKIWSFSNVAVGEVQSYTLYNENGNKRRIFQNFLDAKAGDMIIGYESNPVKKVVAIARVRAPQDGEKLVFEKVEGLTCAIDYQTLKECPELADMEYFQNPQGSLFKLTKDEYDCIVDLIREENPLQQEEVPDTYTKADFLGEVFMTEDRYETLVSVLENKKNIILQGAPGVGKTFTAKRLAYSFMKEKDDSRIEFVQFHQNYSYEDFVMGYKPVEDGFELRNGIFYRFCQKAANQPGKPYFFIIDEINRGNMSKIFGELLMLIEKEYRGKRVTLAYSGLPFSVPENIYIIGMMNTADRSLAMIDYALRRRFSFFEIEPGFDSDGFIHYQNNLNSETLNELIADVKTLNREIASDKSLGKGFCIGHSYFCGKEVCTDEWLHAVVEYDILPMLSEYWFDDASKLQRWENILRGVFQ